MADIPKDSFEFAGTNMFEAYGIRCITYDFLSPPLRPRKFKIPRRSGSYDFGAKYYDDRQLKIQCDALDKPLDRRDIRELSYLLNRKGRIVFWDEPEKHYLGRIYNPAALEYLGTAGHKVVLQFDCGPFAIGELINAPMPTIARYNGTAPTPTRIQITNTGSTAINGIIMTIRERVE